VKHLRRDNSTKNRIFYALFATAFALFLVSTPAFAQDTQTLSDLAEDFSDFSDDITGAALFLASIGLNWSSIYIGHLIDIPPHWGLGLTVGTTTLNLDKLNSVTKRFGYKCSDDFMNKQLLPAYVLEGRIGGFRAAPFDLGFKWGFLPYLPYMQLFKNNIGHSSHLYGIDFRWKISEDWAKWPSLNIGLEADHINGGIRSKSVMDIYDTGDPTIKAITASGDATAGLIWDAWVFNAKFQASKLFWDDNITLYAGIRLGAAITKAGFQIEGRGSDLIVNNAGTPQNLDDIGRSKFDGIGSYLDSQAGHDISFTVTNGNIIGWITGFSANFSTYEGIAFNFENDTYLDISVMINFIRFELGANISYRFQQ
jgi:hypothetical protein